MKYHQTIFPIFHSAQPAPEGCGWLSGRSWGPFSSWQDAAPLSQKLSQLNAQFLTCPTFSTEFRGLVRMSYKQKIDQVGTNSLRFCLSENVCLIFIFREYFHWLWNPSLVVTFKDSLSSSDFSSFCPLLFFGLYPFITRFLITCLVFVCIFCLFVL